MTNCVNNQNIYKGAFPISLHILENMCKENKGVSE